MAQLVTTAVFFNWSSAEPKGIVSAKQWFHWWPVIKIKIRPKVTRVTSNLSYSGHRSLFLILATITVLHTYTCINWCFFRANYY